MEKLVKPASAPRAKERVVANECDDGTVDGTDVRTVEEGIVGGCTVIAQIITSKPAIKPHGTGVGPIIDRLEMGGFEVVVVVVVVVVVG